MSEDKFYKQKPIAPENNKQMVGLRWSLRISVAGWFVYGAFAYAFADIGIISAAVQSWMVLIGSALIVLGAESNTIATAEAALSKLGTDRFSRWDIAAVLASLAGGICTPLITFSTRQPGLADTWWRQVAVNQGPLILGIAGVLDFYGAVGELALSKRDYNQDMAAWLEDKQAWQESSGIVTFKAEPAPEELVFDPSWPKMGKTEFVDHLNRLNGDRATLADPEVLKKFIHSESRNLPSRSTLKRFREMAREGR